jgi:hypothetical protein
VVVPRPHPLSASTRHGRAESAVCPRHGLAARQYVSACEPTSIQSQRGILMTSLVRMVCDQRLSDRGAVE